MVDIKISRWVIRELLNYDEVARGIFGVRKITVKLRLTWHIDGWPFLRIHDRLGFIRVTESFAV